MIISHIQHPHQAGLAILIKIGHFLDQQSAAPRFGHKDGDAVNAAQIGSLSHDKGLAAPIGKIVDGARDQAFAQSRAVRPTTADSDASRSLDNLSARPRRISSTRAGPANTSAE